MSPHKVVVIGGGWSGCSAALSAKRAGAEVSLHEKTDMLLGSGLVGGIIRNNGRYTAAEEAIRIGGGGELLSVADSVVRHSNVQFPGHEHASLYDVTQIEPKVKKFLEDAGVEINKLSRIVEVKMNSSNNINELISDQGESIAANVFIDATGTSGPIGNCLRYGNGCVMCIQRCPAYGGRVSITAKTGVAEQMAMKRENVPGAMSGSGKLNKDSLSKDIRQKLNDTGVVVLPLPDDLTQRSKLPTKACQQYALPEYADNIVILDTGHAKLMTPYFPLDLLRKIEGLEHARYEDPYAGSLGNSIRYTAVVPRNDYMRVRERENLFCAGEKSGIYIGHTEAIISGMLAGHNAARYLLGKALIKFPSRLAVGEFIRLGREYLQSRKGREQSLTFAGSVLFERLRDLNLYTIDAKTLDQRINQSGLKGLFSKSL